jgi:hypothetical protein
MRHIAMLDLLANGWSMTPLPTFLWVCRSHKRIVSAVAANTAAETEKWRYREHELACDMVATAR